VEIVGELTEFDLWKVRFAKIIEIQSENIIFGKFVKNF